MDDTPPIVAIIDDDEDVRRALRRLLASLDYRTREFASGEAYIGGDGTGPVHCVLADVHMDGMSGLDVLRLIREREPALPVIMITGYDEDGLREKCLLAGAVTYLVKPLERAVVHRSIGEALNLAPGR
ncbi:response regulator [Rhodobacterales bacterium]|nr:response regulator [Rhodobacterales bacterium]